MGDKYMLAKFAAGTVLYIATVCSFIHLEFGKLNRTIEHIGDNIDNLMVQTTKTIGKLDRSIGKHRSQKILIHSKLTCISQLTWKGARKELICLFCDLEMQPQESPWHIVVILHWRSHTDSWVWRYKLSLTPKWLFRNLFQSRVSCKE